MPAGAKRAGGENAHNGLPILATLQCLRGVLLLARHTAV